METEPDGKAEFPEFAGPGISVLEGEAKANTTVISRLPTIWELLNACPFRDTYPASVAKTMSELSCFQALDRRLTSVLVADAVSIVMS